VGATPGAEFDECNGMESTDSFLPTSYIISSKLPSPADMAIYT
jgi:hypothetical protein